jgi:hypothetical protein
VNEPNGPARFFDSRAAYNMFVTTTNEKAAVAERVSRELPHLDPQGRALRIFDAGMGDATVLIRLMRRLHQVFTHVPWFVVGKEGSIEDVRRAVDSMPDRFFEHPEMVFAVTNMPYREAVHLGGFSDEEVAWRTTALEGTTAHDFASQLERLHLQFTADWAVTTGATSGNPVPVNPAVHVIYRKDREFMLRDVVPQPGGTDIEYELILASQPYRAATTTAAKVRMVLAPLVEALAPGGRLIGIHAAGDDPALEIIRNVWPDEDPFHTDRHDLFRELAAVLDRDDIVLDDVPDEEAIFQYILHTMPSEMTEHIGTSTVLAAWNAAAYVAQIDEDRLTSAIESGRYLEATRSVVGRHDRLWFNNESYVITRNRNDA